MVGEIAKCTSGNYDCTKGEFVSNVLKSIIIANV